MGVDRRIQDFKIIAAFEIIALLVYCNIVWEQI